MPKDLSPEEKLLRLIRSKAPQPSSQIAVPRYVSPDNTPKPAAVPKESHNALPKPIPRKNQQPHKPARILRMESLNFVLLLLLAGLLIYFVPLFFKKQKNALEDLENKIRIQERQLAQKEEEAKKQPFNYFSEPVASKNIFAPVVKEDTRAPAAAAEEGPKLEDIKAQLNLLGVIWGDNPQAIIEDTKAKKTYFLNKGQSLDNIHVKDIMENKVVLMYKDQQFELVI